MAFYTNELKKYKQDTGFWKGKRRSHLFADSEKELRDLCVKLQIPVKCIRKPTNGFSNKPFVEINSNKHYQAIKLGAVLLSPQLFLQKFLRRD